ncbi:MAG TPA: hypothetical protein VHM30_06470, partial [Gemmatimonadaceae bacterium]|nr:hypothetical protein [Gemmatimonadaceae bacterium]
MKFWRRLSPRFGWALLGLLIAGGVIARVLYVREQSFEELASLLEVSLVTGQSETGAWASAQRDRVVMASQLLAGRDPARPETAREVEQLLGALIEAMRRRGAVGAAAAIDERGQRVAAAGEPELPVPVPDGGDTSSSAQITSTTRCGMRVCVVAREPVRWARGTGWIVLWIAVNDDTFRALNPATRQNRSGRTSLVSRLGDSLAVLASRSNANNPVPRTIAWSRVPP